VNVLSNAIDAARETADKWVRITLEVEAEHIKIIVTDSGTIDDPVVKANMMEAFFTTKKGGIGLGLSVCNRLLRDHGGSLQYDGNATTTTFVLHIPRRAGTSQTR